MNIQSDLAARSWNRSSVRRFTGLVVLCWLLAGRSASAQTSETAAPQQAAGQNHIDVAYQQGTRLLQEGRYSDALEQFHVIEHEAPQSAYGPAGEGIALSLMSRPQEAVEALKRALQIDPSFWIAQRELGIVYWSQNRKDEAVQELDPIAQLYPDDAPLNAILGEYSFARGDYQQALAHLSRIPGQVAADPRLGLMEAEAQLKTSRPVEAAITLRRMVGREGLTNEQTFKLAWLLGQAKLYGPAIDLLTHLPADYPDEFRRNYGLALAYFGAQAYDKSAETLKALRARGNSRPELFALLGVVEERSGHIQDAYDAFREGILKNPSNPQNYLNIATLACQHLNYDLAIEILSSGIDRIPGSNELFLSRGIARTLKTQYALAQQDYHRAIDLAPSNAGNYLALGLSELEAGDLDGSLRSFQTASDREGHNPLPYYFTAEALIQRGVAPGTAEFDRARQAVDAAIALDPTFGFAYRDRGKLELQDKETDRAIADLERARSADLKSSSVAYLLGQAYQQKGRTSEARQLFAQVQEDGRHEARDFQRDSLTEALTVISKAGY